MLSCQGSGPFRNGSCGARGPESGCLLNPGNPDRLSQVSAKLLKGEEGKKKMRLGPWDFPLLGS